MKIRVEIEGTFESRKEAWRKLREVAENIRNGGYSCISRGSPNPEVFVSESDEE